MKHMGDAAIVILAMLLAWFIGDVIGKVVIYIIRQRRNQRWH